MWRLESAHREARRRREQLIRVGRNRLDKTGTLTSGRPELTDVIVTNGVGENELLRPIGYAERDSEHPVARAVVDGAMARDIELVRARDVTAASGFGISACVDERRIQIGTRAYLARSGVDASALEPDAERLALGLDERQVAVDDVLAGLVAVADEPTREAAGGARVLLDAGVEVVMMSGDRRLTAQAVAKTLGIERVIAEVHPEDKAAIVEDERKRGRRVAMVGNGINDALALAAADVGIAVGHGTDIAIAAADVALLRDGVARLPAVFALARATHYHAESVLDVHRQRCWHPNCSRRSLPVDRLAAITDSRERRHVAFECLRSYQFLAATSVRPRVRSVIMKRSAFAVIALLISLVALHAYATTPREIEVIVDGGYKPAKIDIAPGEAVRLKFTRKEYTPCTKDVVFPTLNITRELPVNQPVIIDIPPQQSGEVPFRCGMNMVRGTLVVKAE